MSDVPEREPAPAAGVAEFPPGSVRLAAPDAVTLPTPAHGARHWLAGMLAILGLTALGYGFLWQRGKTLYSPHSDFTAEHLATKTVLYDSVRQGHGVPFWRQDQFSGYTALTNPQSLYTYPLHFLFFLQPPVDAVGGTYWLHFLAAGVSFYLMGSALRLGFWPRLLMAAAGMFSFKLIIAVYAGWLVTAPGIVLFPALFAAVVYALDRPGLGSALAVAVSGGLCLHTGHLQLFYYTSLFCAAYVVVHYVQQARRRQILATVRPTAWLAAGGALAVGMAAYLLLPLAAEAPLVSRSRTTYEFFLGNHALGLHHLAMLFWPEALGTPLDNTYGNNELWEDVAYFGLIPLVLAGAGVVLGWRRGGTRFFAVSFLAALCLGIDSFASRALYQFLPGWGLFRCPNRLLFLAAFFGTVLAGVGLEQVLDRFGKFRRPALGGGLLAGVMIALVALEGSYYARRYLIMAPPQEVLPEADYRSFIAADRTAYRVAPIQRRTVNYGWSAPFGLQLVTGNDSFNFRQYQAYFDLMQFGQVPSHVTRAWMDLDQVARWDMLDALNVKYLISQERLNAPEERLELLAHWTDQPMFTMYVGNSTTDIFLYRNRRALPRAFWAEQVIEAPDESAVLDQMQRRDLARCAVVENRGDGAPPSALSSRDRVQVLSSGPGELSAATFNKMPRLLVVSEVWHPGWRATIDGQPAAVYRVNLALMGVSVPPGEHTVSLHFRPLHWPAALGVSLASGGAVVLLSAAWLVRRLRRRSDSSRER